jgi:hypothetical protein
MRYNLVVDSYSHHTMLTEHRLKEVLNYDPESGLFTWKAIPSRRRPNGSVAGAKGKNGCIDIRLDGHLFRAHRLAWLYMTGSFPAEEIDHIDGNPKNNRFLNLRRVSHAVNMQNIRKAQRNSATGLLGASPWGKRFKARIAIDGTQIKIGVFDTPQEAHAAYLEAKRRLHPGCTI